MLAAGVGWGLFWIRKHLQSYFLFLSSWEMALCRLKYCRKETVNQIQPTSIYFFGEGNIPLSTVIAAVTIFMDKLSIKFKPIYITIIFF